MKNILLYIYIILHIFLFSSSGFAAELDIDSRFRLGKKLIEGKEVVDVMIAIREGKYHNFIHFLRSNHILIKFKSRDLEYVRISVPISSLKRLSSNYLIDAINIENSSPPIFSNSEEIYTSGNNEPRRTLTEILDKSGAQSDILDLESMGLVTLRRNYHYADGRGVTIALIERFIDPETPEMGMAKTLYGKPVPKIRAIYEANSYMAEIFPSASSKPEFSGVQLVKILAGNSKTLQIGGRIIHVPDSGYYRIGIVDETNYAEMEGDFNKDGNPSNKPRTFIVAKKSDKNCFFVDVNQNDDLTDDRCIKDFNVSRQTSRFPSLTNGKTGTRFWILKTPRPDWIVFATPGSHTHFVANSAVGAPAFDPRLSGAAPSAQIISIGASNPGLGSFLEAFIRAAHDPRVDIICVSSSTSAFGQAGSDVRSIILDRIVKRKNKLIFASAGNNANISSSINTLAQGHNVLAVGQLHTSKIKKLFLNVIEPDSSSTASSGGPLIDGRIKPDIIVPSFVVSPIPDSDNQIKRFSRTICPNLIIPARAICAHGTSNASPIAAGAAASLLSVLKMEKITINAMDIVDEIRYSSRHVESIPLYLQGHGVFNVPNTLKNLRLSRNNRPVININAPIPYKMVISTGKTLNSYGLYEREGWHPGEKGFRNIKIRRTTGKKSTISLSTRIIGDESGTYSVPKIITLPYNKEISVMIGINPKTYGVHSAWLELYSLETKKIVSRIGLTIISSASLLDTASNPMHFHKIASNWKSAIIYVDVPKGSAALGLQVDVPKDAFLLGFMNIHNPLANVTDSVYIPRKHDKDVLASLPGAGLIRRVVLWPTPGVWELPFLYQSVAQQQVASVGSVFAIQDREIEQSLELPKNKERQVNMPTNQEKFSVHKISYLYKSGIIEDIDGILPTIFPIKLPLEASLLEFRVRQSYTQEEKESVAIALFECDEDNCEVAGRAVGQGRAALMHLISPKNTLYAAILSIEPIQHRSVVSYEIYFSNAERKGDKKNISGIEIYNNRGNIGAELYRLCYVDAVKVQNLSGNLAYTDIENMGLIDPKRFILHEKYIDVFLKKENSCN